MNKIIFGAIGLSSILLSTAGAVTTTVNKFENKAIKFMLPQFRSIDNGGVLPAIDAYTDGVGLFIEGEFVDNSAMNKLVFKYGADAKKDGINIVDATFNNNPSVADIILANQLKLGNVNSCNDNNPLTIDTKVGGVCFNTPMSCTNGFEGDYPTSIDCSGITGIDFSKWSGLTSINGDLLFFGGNDFNSFTGIYSLSTINGYLAIMDNSAIHSLSTLNSLSSVSAILLQNTDISDLSHINNIKLNNVPDGSSIGSGGYTGFAMINNTASVIPAFPNTTIAASISITDNNNMTTMSGFDNLSKIEIQLEIIRNNNIIDIPNFNGLKEVGNSAFPLTSIVLDIENNQALTTISGFKNIDNIYGYLHIWNNPALTTISGYNKLKYVTRQLGITDNPKLTSLTGFNDLSKIDGMLYLKNNPKLSNMSGLANLKNVEGIYIENSPLLLDLSPFNNVLTTPFFAINQNLPYTTKLSATSALCVGIRAGTIATNMAPSEYGKVCY